MEKYRSSLGVTVTGGLTEEATSWVGAALLAELYRNVGILQEHAVNRILKDLVSLLQPISLVVEAEYRERGGIKTRAVARYEREPKDTEAGHESD